MLIITVRDEDSESADLGSDLACTGISSAPQEAYKLLFTLFGFTLGKCKA